MENIQEQSWICKNCQSENSKNYCSACGQKNIAGRLTWREAFEEFVSRFVGFERGLLHTFIGLTRSPSKVLLDYVHGKRKDYSTPIHYYLIATAITFFFFSYLGIFEHIQGELVGGEVKEFTGDGKRFMDAYYTIMQNFRIATYIGVPLYAFGYFWLARKKSGISYLESIVFTLYTSGHAGLLTLPLLFLYLVEGSWAYTLHMMFVVIYTAVVAKGFYGTGWWKSLFLVLFANLFFILVYIVLGVGAALIMMKYTM